MRTEKEMLALILGIAENDDRIRAVYMNGSRANPNVKKDKYQDYDIVFVVTETAPFINDKNWINQFGNIAIKQEPDSNDCGWGIDVDFSKSYAWLMLFDDGVRIDLQVETVEKAKENNDSLTVVLLDKDNILPEFATANESSYWIEKPTAERFRGCCNEFWWCLNNAAKGIRRDQLNYVMFMYSFVVRNQLENMLDWYIAMNFDFKMTTGMKGKYYKKYLSERQYKLLQKTFSDSDYEHIWSAIFAMCDLFRETANAVADKLGFVYVQSEDDAMTKYLNIMKREALD